MRRFRLREALIIIGNFFNARSNFCLCFTFLSVPCSLSVVIRLKGGLKAFSSDLSVDRMSFVMFNSSYDLICTPVGFLESYFVIPVPLYNNT